MTRAEVLLQCPACDALVIAPAGEGGPYELPEHYYRGQNSVEGREGWRCTQKSERARTVAERTIEKGA